MLLGKYFQLSSAPYSQTSSSAPQYVPFGAALLVPNGILPTYNPSNLFSFASLHIRFRHTKFRMPLRCRFRTQVSYQLQVKYHSPASRSALCSAMSILKSIFYSDPSNLQTPSHLPPGPVKLPRSSCHSTCTRNSPTYSLYPDSCDGHSLPTWKIGFCYHLLCGLLPFNAGSHTIPLLTCCHYR